MPSHQYWYKNSSYVIRRQFKVEQLNKSLRKSYDKMFKNTENLNI